MKTVLVYRVELCFTAISISGMNYTQQGPYTTYDAWMSKDNGYTPCFVSYDPINQPEPENDGLEHTFAVIYGFRDKNQMFDWFCCDIVSLHYAGFVLSIYEVPIEDVNYGRKQLNFYPHDSKLISVESLLDIAEDY